MSKTRKMEEQIIALETENAIHRKMNGRLAEQADAANREKDRLARDLRDARRRLAQAGLLDLRDADSIEIVRDAECEYVKVESADPDLVKVAKATLPPDAAPRSDRFGGWEWTAR